MADDDTQPGMAKDWRPVHGPRPIAAVVPVVARTAFSRAAPGVARLMEGWAGMVGPALGQVTTAKATKPGNADDWLLRAGGDGIAAPVRLSWSAGSISILGPRSVRRLRLVQTASVPGQAKPRPRPTRAAEQAASEAVADLPDGPLRDALNALGRAVLTEIRFTTRQTTPYKMLRSSCLHIAETY